MDPAVAIIPAHNEARYVAAVVAPLVSSGAFRRVLVVSDGSADETARVARDAGAEVLELRPNRGKGGAMLAGVRATTESVVCFFDADLVGLTPQVIRGMVGPVVRGELDMAIGLVDYGSAYNKLHEMLPKISGQRAIRRTLLNHVPAEAWSGFSIEMELNETARRTSARVRSGTLPRVSTVPKWSKTGHGGLLDAVKMSRSVLLAMGRARARIDTPVPGEFACELIIPAHNEEPRVAAVVAPAVQSGCFRRVTVVSDGSTDGTVAAARAAGAYAIDLRPNRGKGGAMRAGFASCKTPWVAFLDADLYGLQPEHLKAWCDEARSGNYGMVCWMLDHVPGNTGGQMALHSLNLSGQRIVHRSILERMPASLWDGYGIECAMNEACSRMGYAERRVLIDGVSAMKQLERSGGSAAESGVRMAKIMGKALQTSGVARTTSW